MARVAVWLFGCLPPLWLRLRRGGCGVSMRVGARMLRELTRRGCLNGAPQARSEFHGIPRNRPDAGLPRSAAKGSQTWGRLLFGDFLLANQEKVTAPPGAHPGSRPLHRHAAQSASSRAAPRFRQAQPARTVMTDKGFDKLSPNRNRSLTPAPPHPNTPPSPADETPSAHAPPPPQTGCPPPPTPQSSPEKQCCRNSNTNK